MKILSIEFGALSDAPSKQLKGLLPTFFLIHIDTLAESLVRLHVHGILNDSQVSKCRNKIFMMVKSEIEKPRVGVGSLSGNRKFKPAGKLEL